MTTEAKENPFTQLASDFADYLMQVWNDWDEVTEDMPPFGFEVMPRPRRAGPPSASAGQGGG